MKQQFGFKEENKFILVKGNKMKPIRFKLKRNAEKVKKIKKLDDYKVEKIKIKVFRKI